MAHGTGLFGNGVVGMPTYVSLVVFALLVLFFLLHAVLQHMRTPAALDDLRKRRVQQSGGSPLRPRVGGRDARSTVVANDGRHPVDQEESRRSIRHLEGGANGERTDSAVDVPSRGEEEDEVMGALSRARRRRMEREALKREKTMHRVTCDSDSDFAANDGSGNEGRSTYRQRQLQRERREHEQELKRRAERLAKKRAEDEEYQQWKAQFSVDEEGGVAAVKEDTQTLLRQFLSYAKARKVVQLDEIAADFGLKTSQVLKRLSDLEAMGFIDGILDDRGRYICVEKEEWEAVAAYINRRGRVSKGEDLVEACNTLIRLRPCERDRSQLEQERTEALSRLVDFEGAGTEDQ